MERIIRRIGYFGVIPASVAALTGAGALLALDDGGADAAGTSGSFGWASAFLANQEPDGERSTIVRSAGPLFEGYLEKLAENLGVTEEQLKEAMKQTSLELLDDAVANGDISEEDAAEIREKIEVGEGPPFFGGGFGIQKFGGGPEFGIGGPFPFGPHLLHDGAVAEYLGISEEQLREELNSDKTLAEVGAAHGKSREELKAFLTDQQEERLDEAVAGGKLSESDAAKIREDLDDQIDHMLDAHIRIHIDGDGLLPGFGEKIENFFDGSRPRLPWRPAPDPSPSQESEDKTY